jgi:hypothetical protein
MHLRAVRSVPVDKKIRKRALLDIAIVVLQVRHQVSKCELSLCGGNISVFLEGDALRRKRNSFTHKSTRATCITRSGPYIEP